jgi:diphosphomevalonate decarboxylase
MLQSETSPFFDRWTQTGAADFDAARTAVSARDFARLGEISEANCLAMHAVMLSARPGLVYWTGATVNCIDCVRRLRGDGTPVFFTIDAGPQVKAVCEPNAAEDVRAALANLPGVERVLTVGLGDGARVIEP